MSKYTTEDVIEELKRMTGESTDVGVGVALGVSKQSINQFLKGNPKDIKMKIITYLLDQRKREANQLK